ncbi:hypothetical protein BDW74DRAFT_164098 [Aspergillus multicolor]|uniref:uncharacterized protein n=1 Tax=Aspergillus multicolor TaxID=41759 RepID=UPI003CCE0DFD
MLKADVAKWEDGNWNKDEQRAAKKTLIENYVPVIMDDRDKFEGMSLPDLRAHYATYLKKPVGERPYAAETLFLVIDDGVIETLAGAEASNLLGTKDSIGDGRKYWVRAVESRAKYEGDKGYVDVVEDEEDDEDDWDDYGEGWAQCSVHSLWNLWSDMDGRPISVCASLYPYGPYGI